MDPKGVGSLPTSRCRTPFAVSKAVKRAYGLKNELMEDPLVGSRITCVNKVILGEKTTSVKSVILILSNALSPLRNLFTSGSPWFWNAVVKSMIPPKNTCGTSPVSAWVGAEHTDTIRKRMIRCLQDRRTYKIGLIMLNLAR
jgi:hypothetical protein